MSGSDFESMFYVERMVDGDINDEFGVGSEIELIVWWDYSTHQSHHAGFIAGFRIYAFLVALNPTLK